MSGAVDVPPSLERGLDLEGRPEERARRDQRHGVHGDAGEREAALHLTAASGSGLRHCSLLSASVSRHAKRHRIGVQPPMALPNRDGKTGLTVLQDRCRTDTRPLRHDVRKLTGSSNGPDRFVKRGVLRPDRCAARSVEARRVLGPETPGSSQDRSRPVRRARAPTGGGSDRPASGRSSQLFIASAVLLAASLRTDPARFATISASTQCWFVSQKIRARFRRFARGAIPRLLLVSRGSPPPLCLDPLEDWIWASAPTRTEHSVPPC